MCWYGHVLDQLERAVRDAHATRPRRAGSARVSCRNASPAQRCLQPRAQGGRGQRPVARQPAVDRRVQDRQRELEVPALGVVGVGQRADRLLRQVAPAELARAAGSGRARCRPRTAAGCGSSTATGGRGRSSRRPRRCPPRQPPSRCPARACPRPRPPATAPRPAAAPRARSAPRSSAENPTRPLEATIHGCPRSSPSSSSASRSISSDAGRPCVNLVRVRQHRRGDLADQPRGRRRVHAQRGRARPRRPRPRPAAAPSTPSRVARSDAGSTRACPIDRRRARVVQRQRPVERERPLVALDRPQQLLELELGQQLRDQLAVRALPDHAARDSAGGSGAPNDWKTLRSRTA